MQTPVVRNTGLEITPLSGVLKLFAVTVKEVVAFEVRLRVLEKYSTTFIVVFSIIKYFEVSVPRPLPQIIEESLWSRVMLRVDVDLVMRQRKMDRASMMLFLLDF